MLIGAFYVKINLMAEPNQKNEEVTIRTLKSDLEEVNKVIPKKSATSQAPTPELPTAPVIQEGQYKTPRVPFSPPLMPIPPQQMGREQGKVGQPPVLVIPPKKIPPIRTKPLYKATPTWIKLGLIGLGIILIVLLGLYGYWKIFIQGQPPETPQQPTATSTPTLPETPSATSTLPTKFFNKLPNKSVTIDLSSKTPIALVQALKSEAAIQETAASVKQIKITYQGNPITAEELLGLMSIFTPQDFMKNYDNDFALAYFSQKEGARPILILRIKDKDLAQTQMKNWENATLTSDILPLFLKDYKLPNNLGGFKSYLFIGQPVRYLNINIAYASLNYAIYNNFLIFTTSSAGMFVVIQDLTGQTVSANYLNSLGASIDSFVK